MKDFPVTIGLHPRFIYLLNLTLVLDVIFFVSEVLAQCMPFEYDIVLVEGSREGISVVKRRYGIT